MTRSTLVLGWWLSRVLTRYCSTRMPVIRSRISFETSALEPVTLKGKTEPVVAYRVDQGNSDANAFRSGEASWADALRRSPTELATLHRCLEKAVADTGSW